jgi:hypothetical protein
MSRSLSKTDCAGNTKANSVAQDLSFLESARPKILSADRFFTDRAASAHSRSLGPRTGCLRYAVASAKLLIE